jgi:hypothetical protein
MSMPLTLDDLQVIDYPFDAFYKVPSSMFSPNVAPVIAWQPIIKNKTTNVTVNILNARTKTPPSRFLRISFFVSPVTRAHLSCSFTNASHTALYAIFRKASILSSVAGCVDKKPPPLSPPELCSSQVSVSIITSLE